MKAHLTLFLWLLTVAAVLGGLRWWCTAGGSPGAAGSGRTPVPALEHPTNLNQLLASAPFRLGECDIALVNLLCAERLPGAESLSPQHCIATLDLWTQHVKSETERHLYRYKANPGEYESSEGYFRMLMMAVVLYEDFRVRYNPERMSTPSALDPNDRFFAHSRDIFLHGLLPAPHPQPSAINPQPNSRPSSLGTCSSMPVLYVAIGRRLGYPLKLATTKAHLFIRWEGAGERFNLEATGKGMNRYDDEHFKQWPFPVTEEEIQADGYLKSLTVAEELALFLSLRGHCLREAGRMSEAIASYAEAVRLAPNSRPYRLLLAAAQQERAQFGSAARLPPVPGPSQAPLGPSLPVPNPLLKLRQQ